MSFTFQDIFKSSFLERLSSVTPLDMLLTLALSFAVGVFIFLIYKKCCCSVMYSSSFSVTLIALTMITSMLILAVTSNVVLSLGMVGALSIVRFRTAIKEPSDIAFLFWAISAGIILAAGFIPLAVFGSAVIGVMLLVFARFKSVDSPYILLVRCDGEQSERTAAELIGASVKKFSVKSKSAEAGEIEINYEIRLKNGDSSFLNELCRIEGVTRAVLVSYNGDYMN